MKFRKVKSKIKRAFYESLTFLFLAALLVMLTPAAQAQLPVPSSSQFDITGFLQEATLDPAGFGLTPDPLAGGTLKVNGHLVIVPRNTTVILPANALTWQELFALAPAPYGLATAAGVPETGMAMNDSPQPFTTYEVQVVGNRIVTATSDLYIAGLIYISQQGLNTGAGYINFIDYANAEMRVGGIIGDNTTGARVRLNDPPRADLGNKGRYSRGQSPDARFTVDQDNPTIVSTTGYPMGLPDVLADPAVPGNPDDPLRPQRNRPKDVLGHFLTIFTMPNPATVTPGTPDPSLQLPFEVGDFVTFAGTLVHDGPNPTAMPVAGFPNTTYISAHTIENNLAWYTWPGTDPAYVKIDVTLLGTGGLTVAGLTEAGKRTRFEGFSTDPSRNVHLFGIDVNVTGGTQDRDWGSINVDNVAVRGRWRFRPPANVLTLPPAAAVLPAKGGGAIRTQIAGTFLPATREVRAAVSTGEVKGNPLAPYTLATQPIVANGIKAGQYHAPITEYIFPENVVGAPIPPDNFETMLFLFDGGYTSSTGTVAGNLCPFPLVWPPGTALTYVPVLNSVFVNLPAARIGIGSTVPLSALPIDQSCVAFPAATVTFSSSNPAVATVSATGLVTGVSPGSATITATAVSGVVIVTGTATVTVTVPIDTFNLTVQAPSGAIAATNVSSISLGRGASGNVLLSVMSAAPGSYIVNVTATSSVITSVVTMTVDGGASSAKTTGVNTIATYLLTVTSAGISNSTTITTNTTVTGISPSIAMLKPLETMQFSSTDPGVTWASSNHTVGVISGSGLFTAAVAGNTTINATNTTTLTVVGSAFVIVGANRSTSLPLVAGYNQVIVPVQSDPALNASRLLQLVTAQNPGVAGRKVVRWNATSQLFETFDPFAGVIDFTIDPGKDYFVNVTAPATNISIVGTLSGIS